MLGLAGPPCAVSDLAAPRLSQRADFVACLDALRFAASCAQFHRDPRKIILSVQNVQVRSRDEPRRTTAMKKHNHSSDDRPIQYRGKYSRHSRGQALTNFASDRHTGATCLKPLGRTIAALAPAPPPLVSLFLS